MGEFIEFIFSNLFLLIIIISGIVGFLSNNKEQQKKERERKARGGAGQRRTTTSQAPRTPTRTTREEYEQPYVKQEPEQDTTISAGSIQAEQNAQLEKLEQKFGGQSVSDIDTENLHSSIDSDLLETNKKNFSEEQRVLRNDLKRSLKNKGLINGIIMAEVLGKPRALHPYESVVRNRYKK